MSIPIYVRAPFAVRHKKNRNLILESYGPDLFSKNYPLFSFQRKGKPKRSNHNLITSKTSDRKSSVTGK